MALDGLCLSVVCDSIREKAIEARVEKVFQPAKDTVVISLRSKTFSGKLLICAGATGARMHFTESTLDNPQTPPMFCMLLRKHLSGGKLKAVRQLGHDRVVFLDFEVSNELADIVTVTLCVEIMGHNSNVILVNEKGTVVDAIKRVNAEVSSVRFVFPGVKYSFPPQQEKKQITDINSDDFKSDILSKINLSPEKALLSLYSGLSPLVCREICFNALKGKDILCENLSDDDVDKLFFYLCKVREYLVAPAPAVLYDTNKKPKEFSFFPVRQYGHAVVLREFESIDSLLDSFYSERDRIERVKQKSGDLLKAVVNISDRIERKLANQKADLEKCADKERLKKYGDIIYANLSAIKKGDSRAILVDFYDENCPEIEVPLDTKLAPAQNAQKYYNEYRKRDTAEKMLTSLIKSGKEELEYIDSVFDSLTRASNEGELSLIRQELYEGRYIRKKADKNKVKAAPTYQKYVSSDGYLILCGRNNIQNDKLTLKEAAKTDIWFHTQNIPGSHTVIVTEGKQVPDTTLEEAAIIAAYNSKARASSKVAVDYTQIKNVKKPSGAKPGMVIYENYKTAIVTPDEEKVLSLAQK